MGICSSCCGKDEEHSQYEGSEERANLIDSNNECVVAQRSQSENISTNYSKAALKKLEEQSDVNKIIQEMATNVIDVGTLGSHGLEQHEYRERMSHYLTRLRLVNTSKLQWSLPTYSILIDMPTPERLLFSDISIPIQEYDQTCSILNDIDSILKNSKIKHKDLLVPFRVS